jgi:hypothetical protein
MQAALSARQASDDKHAASRCVVCTAEAWGSWLSPRPPAQYLWIVHPTLRRGWRRVVLFPRGPGLATALDVEDYVKCFGDMDMNHDELVFATEAFRELLMDSEEQVGQEAWQFCMMKGFLLTMRYY